MARKREHLFDFIPTGHEECRERSLGAMTHTLAVKRGPGIFHDKEVQQVRSTTSQLSKPLKAGQRRMAGCWAHSTAFPF